MSDTHFERWMTTLEQRVGILPNARPREAGQAAPATVLSWPDIIGVMLILLPIGVICGMLTDLYLRPVRPPATSALPLIAALALGHGVLFGAAIAALVARMRYPVLVYGLASALGGYALTGLGLRLF